MRILAHTPIVLGLGILLETRLLDPPFSFVFSSFSAGILQHYVRTYRLNSLPHQSGVVDRESIGMLLS